MRKVFAAIVLSVSAAAGAQTRLTLPEMEAAFRRNNLQLLAEQYNISQADAEVIQAKIWDLPEAQLEVNALNPEKPSFFNVGNYKSLQISQLFLLGGKRRKEVEYWRANKELAQLQYRQLAVELLARLRQSAYEIYFSQKKIENIDLQLGYLADLVKAYRQQAERRNVSLKDAVRLNAIVINLKAQRAEIISTITEAEKNLRILTGLPEELLPEFPAEEIRYALQHEPLLSLEDLKIKAEKNNAEYLYALKDIESGSRYLEWQKSLNTVDISGYLQYNQDGGVFKNEVNAGIAIPLPLWKKNNGNIAGADAALQQKRATAEYRKQELQAEVAKAYRQWQSSRALLNSVSERDTQDLEKVFLGMTENFRRGNVSLIDFTDFLESFNETMMQLSDMQLQVLTDAEEISRLIQVPFN